MAQRHAQPTQTMQQHDQEAQTGGHMQDEQQTTVMTGAAAAAALSPSAVAASVDPQAVAQAAVDATAAAASAGSKRKGAGSDVACSEKPSEGSNQPSSSPAAASASSLHLASEPGSKRAKTTLPPLDVNSPMMRLLGGDSGARQSLMEMLSLAEFAAAHRVSRLWSAWTAESVRGPSVTLDDGSLAAFSQSRWLHRFVHSVGCTTPCWTIGVCTRFFAALSPCKRLRSLTLTLSRFAVSSPDMSVVFSCVASTLQHLRINVAWSQASCLVDLFSGVRAFPQLRSLVIEAMPAGEGHHFSPCELGRLSPLISLPQLERLSAPVGSLPASPSQIESLSQCLQLTHLDFSQWIGVRRHVGESQVREAFATLLRRRKENGAAPLRRLGLGNAPWIRPEDWQLLSQCTELEEIHARWSSTLTAADWSRLSNFQRLKCLSIRRMEGQSSPAMDLSPALSALIHCPRLRFLTLQGECSFVLDPSELTLIAQLSALQVLCCAQMQIESLAPLSFAPALTELSLLQCTGVRLRGGTIDVRELIPPMSLVRKLTIAECSWINSAQASLRAVALLGRLPRLTRDQLHDDRLPDGE